MSNFMGYEPDQWVELISAVEGVGGALLPDKCQGKMIPFSIPKSDQVTKARTCNCKNKSMFVIPYEPAGNKKQKQEMRERGAGFARVCAVCDSVGAWPKFEHVMEDDDA